MKRTIIALIAGLTLLAGAATAAADGGGNAGEKVCPGTHLSPGSLVNGVYTAPEGKLIIGWCAKAGSDQQGNGPEEHVVDPPAQQVAITHSSNHGLSHFSVKLIDKPTPTTSTTVAPTTSTTTSTVAPTTSTTSTTVTPTTSTTTTTVAPTTSTTTPPTTVPAPPAFLLYDRRCGGTVTVTSTKSVEAVVEPIGYHFTASPNPSTLVLDPGSYWLEVDGEFVGGVIIEKCPTDIIDPPVPPKEAPSVVPMLPIGGPTPDPAPAPTGVKLPETA